MYNKKKVVITMTTYPDRSKCVEQAIGSLLYQPEVDELVLNLSIDEYPDRESNLPVFLRSGNVSDKISINYLYGNTKAFKKLIPTLRQEKYRNCIVITCDDDCMYPNGIIGEALSYYTGDSPVCFNVPVTYNWGNGRLSIYEYRFFGDKLTLMERQKIWDTCNDDVCYGHLLSLNGYKYQHFDIESYNRIQFLDSANDMFSRGMYDPYKDDITMKRYLLDRFGLNMSTVSQMMKDKALKYDTEAYKHNKINELVEE